jgi:hypothetical protein
VHEIYLYFNALLKCNSLMSFSPNYNFCTLWKWYQEWDWSKRLRCDMGLAVYMAPPGTVTQVYVTSIWTTYAQLFVSFLPKQFLKLHTLIPLGYCSQSWDSHFFVIAVFKLNTFLSPWLQSCLLSATTWILSSVTILKAVLMKQGWYTNCTDNTK